MPVYELVAILSASLAADAQAAIVRTVRDRVTKAGGQVTNEQIWEKRDLAYPIGVHRQGIYVVTRLTMPAAEVAAFDLALKRDEQILRYLLVRQEAAPAPAETSADTAETAAEV